MKTSTVLFWMARIISALIMLQTLYFKFTGAEESIRIFSTLGMEPWGRIGTGIMELIASALILFSPTVWLGSLLAIGLMTGAILSHITVLGVFRDDGGQLFFYALGVFVCALYSFSKSRDQIPQSIKKYIPSFLQ